MRISIAIMAHPSRGLQAGILYKRVKAMPFTQATLVMDTTNTEWNTGKAALQAYRKPSDWHVVIQDDAILTPDFYENIVSMITTLGKKTLISLYTGTARPLPNRVTAAVNKVEESGFLRSFQLLWGVGIVIPTDHIEPMLEFVEDIDLQYDNKIGEFYCRNGLPVYYCIPSLVDHDDDLETLIDGHGRHISPEPRVAHRLATGPVNWQKKEHFI